MDASQFDQVWYEEEQEPDLEAEFRSVAKRLEMHHELFSQLWKIGEPVFTTTIKTAAIVFSAEGVPLRFLFNPTFWAKLPDYDRQFVVCHEMLHAVLNHGFRSIDMRVAKWANIAADLVVNHLLVNRFGFIRECLQNWQSLCWVDTVFMQEVRQLPATDLTMEEYYALLENHFYNASCVLVDEHLFQPGGENGSLRSARASAELDSMLAGLTAGELQELRDKLGKETTVRFQRGTEQVGSWCLVEPEPPAKMKWEDVLRKKLKQDKEPVTKPGWVFSDRRFTSVDQSLLIPGIAEAQGRELKLGRQKCVFFLDASGSCWDLRNRFFTLVKSLPESEYDVELCSFDCAVYPLDPKKNEVRGSGGTSFSILEQWLRSPRRRLGQQTPTKIQPYPDIVIILTDGYGDKVKPFHPERWHWLLVENHREFISRDSVTYLLTDFA